MDDIVIDYVYLKMTIDEIVEAFHVEPAAVHAALSYYYDNKVEVEQQITADEKLVEEFRRNHVSPLSEKLKAINA